MNSVERCNGAMEFDREWELAHSVMVLLFFLGWELWNDEVMRPRDKNENENDTGL